ncbi:MULTISPECIES: hypothetical protein [unclassified Bacillus (in: firmicutes)]|nr:MULTISPECIES: hypothetical protein [unclassified Bacillus (in: firmicutes)]
MGMLREALKLTQTKANRKLDIDELKGIKVQGVWIDEEINEDTTKEKSKS